MGEDLYLSGDVAEAFEDLCDLAGDACSGLDVDAKTGLVSFDASNADLNANEGARLINQLVTSDNTYDYSVSTTEQTLAGPLTMSRLPGVENNLDNSADREHYGNGKPDSRRPPEGVDDEVTLNPSRQYSDSLGRPVPESNVAFHELAEAYAKVDEGKPYTDSLAVRDGAVLVNFTDPGAHSEAVQRERTLRDQRPNLKTTGRAGDDVKLIIRDPH